MTDIKAGDRVRVKDRPDWPSPPGYQMANSEGRVYQVLEDAGFVTLRLEKTNVDVLEPGTTMVFPVDAVEKI